MILPEAEAVFQKALAVKPEDRYQSAGDFWNALRMIVLGYGMSDFAAWRDRLVR